MNIRLALDRWLAIIGFKPSAALIEEAIRDTMKREPYTAPEIHAIVAYLELGAPMPRHVLQRIGATIGALRNTIEAQRAQPELRESDLGLCVMLRDPCCTLCDEPLSAHSSNPAAGHDFRHTWWLPVEKLSPRGDNSDRESPDEAEIINPDPCAICGEHNPHNAADCGHDYTPRVD